MKAVQLENRVFGRLKVIRRDGTSPLLLKGSTKSCGCLYKISNKDRNKVHGHAVGKKPTRTYSTWMAMRRRCNDTDNHNYYRYGGRGIKVCSSWNSSFENFLIDMGERPKNKTIDRIDNSGNYEPKNCRWATPLEQIRNRG